MLAALLIFQGPLLHLSRQLSRQLCADQDLVGDAHRLLPRPCRMVAAITHLPVVGVPVKTSTLSGNDSLLSIVQVATHPNRLPPSLRMNRMHALVSDASRHPSGHCRHRQRRECR